MVFFFIKRYNNILLLLLFSFLSFSIFILNNDFQKTTILNSANKYIGIVYNVINQLKEYINLKNINNSLILENISLKNDIIAFINNKDLFNEISFNRYNYIYAKVINNNISGLNNYLTLNKGLKHNIKSGMGVISTNGIVGIIRDVSENFSTVYSVLNRNIKISVKLQSNNAIGSLSWDGNNIQYANLNDIPIHINVYPNDVILTTGYSIFTENTQVGVIVNSSQSLQQQSEKSDFWNLKIKLFTHFATLQYVYIIVDNFQYEKNMLEKLYYND